MSDVGATTRTLTGSGPLFHEALYRLADMIEERCPSAWPAVLGRLPTAALPARLEAWAEGGQWHVRAEVEPL